VLPLSALTEWYLGWSVIEIAAEGTATSPIEYRSLGLVSHFSASWPSRLKLFGEYLRKFCSGRSSLSKIPTVGRNLLSKLLRRAAGVALVVLALGVSGCPALMIGSLGYEGYEYEKTGHLPGMPTQDATQNPTSQPTPAADDAE
jgi:hypothetical protein